MGNPSHQPYRQSSRCARLDTGWLYFPEANEPDDASFLVGPPALGPGVVSVAASVTAFSGSTAPATRARPEQTNPIRPNLRPSRVQARFGLRRLRPSDSIRSPTKSTASTSLRRALIRCRQSQARFRRGTSRGFRIGLVVNAQGLMLAGTSQASPVITGLIANLLADSPNLTLPQVLDLLRRASHIPDLQFSGGPRRAARRNTAWAPGLLPGLGLRTNQRAGA